MERRLKQGAKAGPEDKAEDKGWCIWGEGVGAADSNCREGMKSQSSCWILFTG